MAVDYIPPVKKTGALPLICDGAPHRLDVGDLTPVRTALTHAHTYFNIDGDYSLNAVGKPGRLRIYMARGAYNGEPIDETYFFDLWLDRPGYSFLDSRALFERADKGRPLRWYYQVNGAKGVTLKTRFVKYAQVY